jgi:hypothetical protein
MPKKYRKRRKEAESKYSVEVLDPEEEENFPVQHIVPPSLKEITPDTSYQDHVREDARHTHYVLSRLYLSWDQPLDLQDTCRLALTTAKMLQVRRDVLNRQYGYLRGDKNSEVIIPPLE